MVLVLYKGSDISVLDRFFLKKTVLFWYMYQFLTLGKEKLAIFFITVKNA